MPSLLALTSNIQHNITNNMKAKIEQSILNTAIESAMLAISNKPANPIVGCIVIEADDEKNNLIIKSTNTTFSIYQIIDAEIDEAGSIAIPAKILKDTIASLTRELSLESDDGYLAIAHETGQCRLMTNANVDEFPDIVECTVDGEYLTIAMSAKKLQVAMDSVIYAACTDETKMIINGVNFDVSLELIATATDGHRVARVCTALDETQSDSINFTIPSKVLTEVSKILRVAPENSDCTLNVYTNIVIITIPGIKIISRLLADNYPPIQKLIPQNFKSEYTIERKALLATLKRVLNLADKKDKSVAVSWDISNCTATLTTESYGFGDAYDKIHMKPQTESKENSTIGFNVDYLTETINSITTDEIVIKCNEPSQPVIICPVGGLLDQLGLVMPLQIKRSNSKNATPKTTNIEASKVGTTDISHEPENVAESSAKVVEAVETTEVIPEADGNTTNTAPVLSKKTRGKKQAVTV